MKRMRRDRPSDAWLKIEDPGGPGLEVAWEADRGLVVAGARPGTGWIGLDRAVVVETDTGDGTPLAAVVALPSSAPTGSLVRARVTGAYQDAERTVVAATMAGHPMPVEALVRVAARVKPEARALGASAAAEQIRIARERYRRRRAEGRRTDRPAWLPVGIGTGQVVTTGHSGAERGLAGLPPRFVRGLGDFLDDDERVLASAHRAADERIGLLPWRLPIGARDRRAALLVLTDRQLAWLVDHVAPDRYLMDWGVDVTLAPIEAVGGMQVTAPGRLAVRVRDAVLRLDVRPDAGPELDHVVERARPFLDAGDGASLRRLYPIEVTDLDTSALEPFHQNTEAERRLAALRPRATGGLVAAFYAPRRERVRRAVAVGLAGACLLVDDEQTIRELPLGELTAIELSLSPLVGRIRFAAGQGTIGLSYPSPLNGAAAAFVRRVRRAWANTA